MSHLPSRHHRPPPPAPELVAAANDLFFGDTATVVRLAKRSGTSRATLYRRYGSKRALLAAIRAEATVSYEMGVRERALRAAADILEEEGVDALTMARVAARAGTSLAALYKETGGRRGLLQLVYQKLGGNEESDGRWLLRVPPRGARALERVLAEYAAERLLHLSYRARWHLREVAPAAVEQNDAAHRAALAAAIGRVRRRDAETLATAFGGQLAALAHADLDPEFASVAALLARCFVHGLRA